MDKTIVILPIHTLKLVNVSGAIHVGKAKLIGVCISGDGANGDADVYDGVNNLGERKAHLEVLSGTTCPVLFGSGIYIDRGLYIVVNAATTFVMVTYQPLGKQNTE